MQKLGDKLLIELTEWSCLGREAFIISCTPRFTMQVQWCHMSTELNVCLQEDLCQVWCKWNLLNEVHVTQLVLWLSYFWERAVVFITLSLDDANTSLTALVIRSSVVFRYVGYCLCIYRRGWDTSSCCYDPSLCTIYLQFANFTACDTMSDWNLVEQYSNGLMQCPK